MILHIGRGIVLSLSSRQLECSISTRCHCGFVDLKVPVNRNVSVRSSSGGSISS